MRVVLFGASGMVGQGVLRECLLDPEVERVRSVVRRPTGVTHPKLTELVHDDFTDFDGLAGEFAGAGACFYCLGVSAAGMSEAQYTRITYDYTMAAARTLARVNPELTFVYVTGQGTDSTEHGRRMWARVKGRTENALFDLFPHAYAFRPGFIQPMHGEKARTRWYRYAYAVMAPVAPLLRRLFPRSVTTTEQVGRAMLHVARSGAPQRILHNRDLTSL